MGTRLFCDHCGNTVHKFNYVSFGQDNGQRDIYDYHDALIRYQNQNTPILSQMGIGQYGGHVSLPSLKSYPRTTIELCDNCLPIWLKRVENLTRVSDPDQEQE